MSTIAGDSKPPHILIFPYPASGHSPPLLDLTHQLALNNFIITIVTTPKNLSSLSSLLSAHPSMQTLIFSLPSHPSIPSGIENIKELGNKGNLAMISSLSKLHDHIIQWFHSHDNPPVALISDFFLGWTLRLANEVNILRFGFYSTRVFLPCVFDYCWNNFDVVKCSDVVDFVDLPNSPSFDQKHLPSIFRLYDAFNPDCEIVKSSLLSNLQSYGCIFNSFDALESDYLDFLRKKMGHERVYGVGPLSPSGLDQLFRDDSGLGSVSCVLDWLDCCPDGSVVYVCFGSQKLMTNEQMEALAMGLENSMTRFIWVVKSSNVSGFGSVPNGFDERVAGRGVVIRGWAPQVKLLSHSAVGGFVSHCGWNSVLEGIVSGVLMLCWPMEADQFVNERLLVDELGVGVRVCMGGDSVPDSGELRKVIGESMNGAGCEEQKMKAKELKNKAFSAISDGGSSFRDFNRLVDELRKIQVK